MVLHGKVHDGVIVLEDGEQLPEGARVTVIADVASQETHVDTADLSSAEHSRILSIIDRIAALPAEGATDLFSGADHDRALYGTP